MNAPLHGAFIWPLSPSLERLGVLFIGNSVSCLHEPRFHRWFMLLSCRTGTPDTKEVYNGDHEQRRATRGGRPEAAF